MWKPEAQPGILLVPFGFGGEGHHPWARADKFPETLCVRTPKGTRGPDLAHPSRSEQALSQGCHPITNAHTLALDNRPKIQKATALEARRPGQGDDRALLPLKDLEKNLSLPLPAPSNP